MDKDYFRLSEFLEGRSNRYGENVVDIVIDLVRKLEGELKDKEIIIQSARAEIREKDEFLEKSEADNQRYTEVLEFYADIKNWTESTVSNHFNAPDDPVLMKEPPAAIEDSGEKARQELEESNND
ncbi:hypothetical protein [Oceanobacillus jeddahense]|uniref:hypothetical protein n=1 Tax=Oceanobacillus jeddahense TaxID=1462527 RepID=UPI000595E5C0|nr:hypothetical protein [Oceanobacillus jeddahense]